MKRNVTELVMILDRSGSMAGLEADTIGGYNSMLQKQREAGGEVLVSTVLFDDRCEVLHDRIHVEEMEPMTDREYYVRGSTALLDAVGKTIRHIGNIHKNSRPQDRPGKTIIVITTDGMENASREYSYSRVKMMVERQKKRFGWEFLFLGANMDAIGTAENFGILSDRAVNFLSDSKGTELNFRVLAETVRAMRAHEAPIGAGWKEEIEKDYASRSRGQ